MVAAPQSTVAAVRRPGLERTLPLAAGVGSYALAVGAMMATTVAVLSGGWIEGAGATVIVAAVAVTEAILLGRSGLNRLGALLLAIPLCAAVVIPVTLGVIVPDSDSSILHLLDRYLRAALTGLAATDDWAFTVGLGTVLWMSGYWLGWVAFRERSGVLAVLPAVVILAVNALNALNALSAPALGQVGFPETVALILMLLLVGSIELGTLASSWRWRRVPTLPHLRARFNGSMVAAVAGVVALGLLLPPATTTDISGTLFPSNVIGDRGGGSGPGGGAGSLVEFSASTNPGGPLKSVVRQVLTYYTDQPVQAYLRVVNDSVFSAGNWLPDGAAPGTGPVSSISTPPGPLPRDRNPADGGVGGATTRVDLHITSMGNFPTGSASYALFAGEPDAVSSYRGTVIGVADNTGRSFLAVDAVALTGNPANSVSRLDTTAMLPTASAEQLRAAPRTYPGFVEAADLQLGPDEGGQLTTIRNLATQWTAGTTNAYDAAVAIETHLRGFTYTLSPPSPPSGEWPISYFLTTSQRGYCQYFASSMGAMLRSLRIPARVVTGYGPGTTSDAPRPRSDRNLYQVSTSDAHSWVEAYFPGYGWVPFEPTPPSTQGDYLPFQRGGQAQAPTSAASAPSRAGAAAATPTPGAASAGAGSSSAAGRLRMLAALTLALVLLIGLAGLGLRWWRRPRSLAGVWRRLALAAVTTRVYREPAETRAAYARRLAAALGGKGEPQLADQLGVVAEASSKAEFGRDGIDAGDTRRWRAAWDDIARQMPGLLRRRLRRRSRPGVNRGRAAPDPV